MPCPVCLTRFERKRKTQKACSRECYLILWHAENFIDAYRAGQADGLKETIEGLRIVK